MKPSRFLILTMLLSIGHADKAGAFGSEDVQYLDAIASALRGSMERPETIMSGRTIAIAGVTSRTAAEIFAIVGKALRRGDTLHVMEIGKDFATTQGAFDAWMRDTRWIQDFPKDAG